MVPQKGRISKNGKVVFFSITTPCIDTIIEKENAPYMNFFKSRSDRIVTNVYYTFQTYVVHIIYVSGV